MSLEYFEEKKYLIAISFYLFIAILCAKILCVTSALKGYNSQKYIFYYFLAIIQHRVDAELSTV